MDRQTRNLLSGIENHSSQETLKRLFKLETGREDDDCVLVWKQYARFMTLKILNGDFESSKLSPSWQVGEMWHLHLVDTRCYAKFCKDIFPPLGPFIHHDPFGKYDRKNEQRQALTRKLYAKVFKEGCPFYNEEKKKEYKHTLPCQWKHTERKDLDKDCAAAEKFFILVKTLDGKSIQLLVSKITTLKKLKNMIYFNEGIPQEHQSLTFQGARLDPWCGTGYNHVLSDFGICENSVLLLSLELHVC